jgi:hypothetical protein
VVRLIFNVEKKLSIAALSQMLPDPLIGRNRSSIAGTAHGVLAAIGIMQQIVSFAPSPDYHRQRVGYARALVS